MGIMGLNPIVIRCNLRVCFGTSCNMAHLEKLLTYEMATVHSHVELPAGRF